jgi:hypothetical protein
MTIEEGKIYNIKTSKTKDGTVILDDVSWFLSL